MRSGSGGDSGGQRGDSAGQRGDSAGQRKCAIIAHFRCPALSRASFCSAANFVKNQRRMGSERQRSSRCLSTVLVSLNYLGCFLKSKEVLIKFEIEKN